MIKMVGHRWQGLLVGWFFCSLCFMLCTACMTLPVASTPDSLRETMVIAGGAGGVITVPKREKIDTTGDGKADTEEVTIAPGPALKAAASTIPFGEIALGVVTAALTYVGATKYRRKLLDTEVTYENTST